MKNLGRKVEALTKKGGDLPCGGNNGYVVKQSRIQGRLRRDSQQNSVKESKVLLYHNDATFIPIHSTKATVKSPVFSADFDNGTNLSKKYNANFHRTSRSLGNATTHAYECTNCGLIKWPICSRTLTIFTAFANLNRQYLGTENFSTGLCSTEKNSRIVTFTFPFYGLESRKTSQSASLFLYCNPWRRSNGLSMPCRWKHRSNKPYISFLRTNNSGRFY